jgi:DNA-binding MarR family transcriptional regulator
VDQRSAREDAVGRIMDQQLRLYRLFALDRSDPLLTVHLTMSQLKIMLLLAVGGEISAHDLTATLGVSPATITGIVDRLTVQNLVTRREDRQDRRVRRLELTAAGRELVDGIITAGADRHRRLLERIEPAGLELVGRALEVLLEAAEAEQAAEAGQAAEPGHADGASTEDKVPRTVA